MSLYRPYNTFHQHHVCSNKTGARNNVEEEGLVFEMEDEELGNSIDSLCRKCSVGSPDIPVGESNGGSIVQHGPERPETLRIATANRVRRDQFYGSFTQNIQDIKYDNHQLSSTFEQDNSWDLGLERRENSSSVSSVEEATEVIPAILNRQDIGNTEVISQESNFESATKSPRFLPKFIRASFSRLISKDKTKTNTPTLEPMSLPFFSTISISTASSPTWSIDHSDTQQQDTNDKDTETPDMKESLTCSPTTKQFVQDSLAKGLPLIPFYYSAADIVEKRRTERISSTSHYE